MTAKSRVYRSFKTNGLTISLSPLHLEPTQKTNGHRRVYRLVHEFVFVLSHQGGFQEIRVPANFETDLASMPRLGELVVGRRDSPGVLEAAVIHDFLAVQGVNGTYANCVMRYILSVTGVPKWKQRAIFWAIMSFGPGSRFSWLTKSLGVGVSSDK